MDRVDELEDSVDLLQRQCDDLQTKVEKALKLVQALERRINSRYSQPE